MISSSFLFTSESVSEGHPDKVADQISDAVLDAILAQDKHARVAAETLCNTGLRRARRRDHDQRRRSTIQPSRARRSSGIGYDNTDYGIDYKGCAVLVAYDKQSPDIAQGVDEGRGLNLEQGAGDQGLMFGYACDETPELMPLPIYLAHRLVEKPGASCARRASCLAAPGCEVAGHGEVRRRQADGNRHRRALDAASPGHRAQGSSSEAVIEEIIKPVLPKEMIDKKIKYLINPTGRFVIGGPQGDCGLTGRKIIVDTYGGAAPHGGGAFSGKDPSKVDRSAAYAARYVAKNIVAAGLAEQVRRCRCRTRSASPSRPAIMVDDVRHRQGLATSGSRSWSRKHFDLRPKGIVQMLDLLRPIYAEDRGLRPLRPHRAGVHLGKDRQGRGARGRRRRQARRQRLSRVRLQPDPGCR